MREIDEYAQPVAGFDDVDAKLRHAIVLRAFGLKVAQRVADVMHELQVAQPVGVELFEQFETVRRKARAFHRDHDVRRARPRGVDIGGFLHVTEAVRRQVLAHGIQSLAKVACLLAACRDGSLLECRGWYARSTGRRRRCAMTATSRRILPSPLLSSGRPASGRTTRCANARRQSADRSRRARDGDGRTPVRARPPSSENVAWFRVASSSSTCVGPVIAT